MRMRMWMRHAHGTLLIELMILQKVCSRFRVGVEERRSSGRCGQRICSSPGMMMMVMMGIQKDGRILWRVAANRWRSSSRASSSTSACTDARHTNTPHPDSHAHCNVAVAVLGLALVGFAARALALPRIGARTNAGIERCCRRSGGRSDVGAGSNSGGRRKLQLAVDARLEHVALRCGAIQYELLELGVLLGAASVHRLWLLLVLLLFEQRSRLGWHFLVDVIAAAAATAMEAAAAALAVDVAVAVAAANHNFRYDKRLRLQLPLLAHSTQHCAVL